MQIQQSKHIKKQLAGGDTSQGGAPVSVFTDRNEMYSSV